MLTATQYMDINQQKHTHTQKEIDFSSWWIWPFVPLCPEPPVSPLLAHDLISKEHCVCSQPAAPLLLPSNRSNPIFYHLCCSLPSQRLCQWPWNQQMHFPSVSMESDLFPNSTSTSDCTDLYPQSSPSHLSGMHWKRHITQVHSCGEQADKGQREKLDTKMKMAVML